MNSWPYTVYTYSPDEVQKYCVNDPFWQRFRLSLKGLSTSDKLYRLEYWLVTRGTQSRNACVQVSNYINALKRGGQLDMDLKVQR